jgi:eukaryotic-like serine/threonine-protein kinase
VIRTCLAKDPDERWQSARDVRAELQWISESGSQAGAPAVVVSRRRWRERVAWAVITALAATAVAGLAWALQLRRALTEASGPLHAEIVPPPGMPIVDTVLGALALSPDGRQLAFLAAGPPERTLAVRDLGGGETKRLAGTEGATFPFWSPDSRWIGFFADRKLRKVAATGGPVQNVCDVNAGRGGSWGRDGTIVFAPDIQGPLLKVSAGGGPAVETTKVASANISHRNPWFLPDGVHFLLTVRDTARWEGGVALGSLDGGAPVALLERGSNPQYADGFLFTVADGNLVVQPFDAERKRLSGQAVPVADGVEYFNARDLGQYSVSGAGLAVYRRKHLRTSQLTWLDRAGNQLGSIEDASYCLTLAPASDGKTVAAVRANKAGGAADVWLLDLQRAQATRATFAAAAGDMGVAISPDGTRLAVSVSSVGSGGGGASGSVWIQWLSGSGPRQGLLENVLFTVTAWSPDGALLVGHVQRVGSGFDVAYVALADPSKIVRITTSAFDERFPALSPDGHWVAYSSNETGTPEVFVSDFPAATRRWQVSRAGGYLPSWRGDGRELYFLTPKGPVAVSVAGRGDVVDLGEPQALPFSPEEFSLAAATGFGNGPAIHSPDGKRFLVARYASPPVEEPIRLIRSWRPLVDK